MRQSVKKARIHLSLYILIPLIFSGLTIIAVIVTYRLMARNVGSSDDALVSVTIWVAILGAITFVSAFLILWFVLKPLEDFVRHTESLSLLTTSYDDNLRKGKTRDEVQRYSRVLTQVSNLLTRVEVKELFPNIVGQSQAMRAIFTQLLKVAPTDSTVLITGESGTGKELIATSIYEHSRRKEKPFIKINCVAIPEGLLESELFGHERGAFTGAVSQKKGKFEIANGGTVFLDEIGDIPEQTQAKLLRVLQEREFERVGGSTTIKVDVRFITATNKKVTDLIEGKQFREDLYYRINAFSLELPPLRNRREDIPILTEHFMKENGRKIDISTDAMQVLMMYAWPGNIRELKNIINKAIIMCGENIIERQHLDIPLKSLVPNHWGIESGEEHISIDHKMADMEKEYIKSALYQANGLQVKAARILGINQRSLWHRIKKYGIDVSQFKD